MILEAKPHISKSGKLRFWPVALLLGTFGAQIIG